MNKNETCHRGLWHGRKCYFGFHHDLHVDENDRDIGTRCGEKELVPMLRLTGADWVQTDSKGHTGLTSWFSKTSAASVGPGVKKDALRRWRAATRRLRLPLHAHYSGIWDIAAALKHPEWCATTHDGKPGSTTWMGVTYPTCGKMCPRGPYLEELMIPQLVEMMDRYNIDGFWIDGDLWGVDPCYCGRCRKAFTERTGIAEPPKEQSDPNWATWWNFTRESFEEYVGRYCDAVHRHNPGVLVCSNWLQTFKHPGEPKAPTDWISGDNTAVWGVDSSRCEARFISTRGKPWDIMLWCFYYSDGWLGDLRWSPVMKPVQMLQQEASIILAFGGNLQTCENPFARVRSGRLIHWHMKRIRELGRFATRRRALCQDTETIPQVAVLHSEHHVRTTQKGRNLMDIDVAPVQGAVFSLAECHYGIDVLDEWALLPRLAEFPVVVAPEQDCMSQAMVNALKDYVQTGGRLLLSGAKAFERFGAEFLGVNGGRIENKAVYHVPAMDGVVPVLSDPWRLVEPAAAESLGFVRETPLSDEQVLPNPAATVNRVGRGEVAYIPCSVFRDFTRCRYPMVRAFVHNVMRKLAGRMGIEVHAPVCVDVVLRQKGEKKMVHLINRSSGIPNLPNNGVIDDIPSTEPIAIRMRLPSKPKKVHLAFEKAPLGWNYAAGRNGGLLTVDVGAVHIHAAVVVECRRTESGQRCVGPATSVR